MKKTNVRKHIRKTKSGVSPVRQHQRRIENINNNNSNLGYRQRYYSGGGMRIINDNMDIRDFDAWSGAIETQKKIIDEGKAQEFNELIDELHPEGLTDTQLNDILWFEEDWIFEQLNIEEEE